MRVAIVSAGRLIAGLVALTAAATACQRAYRFLPAVIRASSPGFLGLLALNFSAMYLREVIIGHGPALPALLGWAASAAVMVALRKTRWIHGMALYLAASVGVDVLSGTMVLAGVGVTLSANWFVAWKLAAAAIGQHQMTRSNRQAALA